jgi:hypothetical protein
MITRALVVCLLAGILIQPAAAGISATGLERKPGGLHLPDAISLADFKQSSVPWVLAHSALATMARVTGNSSLCNQKLALGADPRCVTACDTSRDTCERQCGSTRSTCMAQCPALGFACDYYCQAAYLVCKANCGRAHEGCVSNCPAKGGEKES